MKIRARVETSLLIPKMPNEEVWPSVQEHHSAWLDGLEREDIDFWEYLHDPEKIVVVSTRILDLNLPLAGTDWTLESEDAVWDHLKEAKPEMMEGASYNSFTALPLDKELLAKALGHEIEGDPEKDLFLG